MLHILPLRLGKVCAMLLLVLSSICKGDMTYIRLEEKRFCKTSFQVREGPVKGQKQLRQG